MNKTPLQACSFPVLPHSGPFPQHTYSVKVSHLDQKSQVNILRLGSLSVSRLDVVSLDINTLSGENRNAVSKMLQIQTFSISECVDKKFGFQS